MLVKKHITIYRKNKPTPYIIELRLDVLRFKALFLNKKRKINSGKMVYKTESISERTIEVLESEKLNYTMYKQEKEQSRSSRQNKSMKTKFSMSLILFFIAHFSFAQMNDGTYNYENTKIKLTLILTDDGRTIESATIHYFENNKVEKGTGLFRTANEMLWGEFQTETCNYEIEFKENTLTLNLKSFECKNGIKPTTYILKQKTT